MWSWSSFFFRNLHFLFRDCIITYHRSLFSYQSKIRKSVEEIDDKTETRQYRSLKKRKDKMRNNQEGKDRVGDGKMKNLRISI